MIADSTFGFFGAAGLKSERSRSPGNARRGEDEAMVRDTFLVRRGGDDPGPAGRLLIAWRSLDRSAPLSDDVVFHVAETLQLKVNDALRAAIADVQQLAASAEAAPFAGRWR
jgi:hypothetical protein